LSEEEVRQAQGFESDDPRRAAGLRFVREVVETRGHPSDEALDGAREAGYSDEEILEMVAHVALTTFSNYTNDLAGTELDILKTERLHG
jgi:alkylhydroperoxidase family enzyme